MVELEREKLQQNSRMEQLMTALLGQMGGVQPTHVQPANAEMTPEKSRPAVVVPEMPGAGPATGEKLTRPGNLAQAAGSDSQEVAELKEGHTKVLSGTKKERNQWVFFVVKGIIGQRYYDRSKFRFQN